MEVLVYCVRSWEGVQCDIFGYLFQLLIKFDLHDFTFDFTNNGEHNHLGLVHKARHPIKSQGLLQWIQISGAFEHPL